MHRHLTARRLRWFGRACSLKDDQSSKVALFRMVVSRSCPGFQDRVWDNMWQTPQHSRERDGGKRPGCGRLDPMGSEAARCLCYFIYVF